MNIWKDLSIGVLSILVTASSQAGMDPYLIKGVHELINPSCQKKLSPVYAMGMIKSGILPNIRFYGAYGKIPTGEEARFPSCQWANPHLVDHDDCPLDYTSALIQSLFPSHARGHLVANQGSKDDPISQLTPENLGSLIELIHLWKIPNQGEPDDLWTLQVIRALKPANVEIRKISLQSLTLALTQCDMNHQDSAQLGQLLSHIRSISEEFNKHPTKKARREIDLSHSISELKRHKLWRSIEPWARILYHSIQEAKPGRFTYPDSTPEHALLSYLLLKKSTKESLLEFLNAIPSCLSPRGRELTHFFSRQRLTASHRTKDVHEFLHSHFTEDEYKQFTHSPTDADLEDLAQDPEKLGYFYYQKSFSELPPLIGGQSAAHKSLGKHPDGGRKYHLYPDCGEASLRNFFNIVLYDSRARTFRSEFLTQIERQHHLSLYTDISKKGKPGRIGLQKGLQGFYSRNATLLNLDSDQVRDDWSRRVVSQLPGVNYMKPQSAPQCEINAGVDNALKVIGVLLGDPKIIHPITTGTERKEALDHLCHVLSRDGFQLTWRSKTRDLPRNLKETLIFSINNTPSFEWSFMPMHFNLTQITNDTSHEENWSRRIPKNGAQRELKEIWEPIEKENYPNSQISNLWNQNLRNSQIRLEILDQAAFNQFSGPIAHHLAQGLPLLDEYTHQNASVAALKTQYQPFIQELMRAPEGIRAMSAAYTGDLAQLLNLRQFLSYRDSAGKTLAHAASYRGQVEALKIITDHTPGVLNEQDDEGWTPASVAAYEGQIEVLRFIHDKAPQSLSFKNDSGTTPAHEAARNGKVEALRFIFEKTPQALSEKDDIEFTPAHLAVEGQHLEALKFIIEKAPDTLRQTNVDGLTPVHLAAHEGLVEVLKVIEDMAPGALNLKNEGESNPAHAAALEGQTEVLQFIIERAPETLRARNDIGSTPAHDAAAVGHLESLKLIVQHAPDILRERNQYGSTAAHDAAQGEKAEVLKFIAEIAPETLELKNDQNESALSIIRNDQLRDDIKAIINQHKNQSPLK